MLFTFSITTPANTLASAKQQTSLALAAGIISHVWVQFPPGPAALLHLQIADELHQVIPANPDNDLASDDETIEWDDEIDLTEPPYELQAHTWNLDDTYLHLVIIHISLIPAAEWAKRSTIWDRLGAMLGLRPKAF